MDRHPYVFRADPTNPPSLYKLSAIKLLARYNYKDMIAKQRKLKKLNSKTSFERAKKQLTKYFGLLNDLIKADLMEMLFHYKWGSYRQSHKTILDVSMMENDICPTLPEECSGIHELDLQVPNLEYVMLWKILLGKTSSNLNMLHFMEFHHQIETFGSSGKVFLHLIFPPLFLVFLFP